MDVMKFKSNLFGNLNVFEEEDGNLWFFGRQVAEKLGYAIPRKAVLDHTDENDRKYLKKSDCSKTEQSKFGELLWENPRDRKPKLLINEAGLYSLILSSKLDDVREFKNWVTHEVLPSIRKYGGYIQGQEALGEEDKEDMLLQISELSEKVKFLRRRRKELRKSVAALKIKAKKAKRENKALTEYCDMFESMFDKVQKDYFELLAKQRPEEFSGAPKAKKGFRIQTDAFGNVLKIESEIA